MNWRQRYRLRLRRKYWLLRALRKSRQLKPLANRTKNIRSGDIIVMTTLRNERIRLPYFLKYYRDMGVRHFLIVDNDSSDGSDTYLLKQEDVSLWQTQHSYRASAYGVDWLNWLARRYAHGHWTLTVDVDEFLVYPYCDTRPLKALTDWLSGAGIRSMSAMLLDMYPKSAVEEAHYEEGQNPFEVAPWFDSANYVMERNPELGNLWIQGGPRARVFFMDNPYAAPALNKTPLVYWNRRYVYVSSTHALLPRSLNITYDRSGGEQICGMLLHTKFLNTFVTKIHEELDRKEHYKDSQEYQAYAEKDVSRTYLWTEASEEYVNWRQLETLGLMSKGNWA